MLLKTPVRLFEPIFEALNGSGGRYVVVGGLATVLHGHARLTADVDLVIDFEPQSVRSVIQALEAIGFRPRAPVPAIAFADAASRREWIETKGMRVFSLWDASNPMREIDVFIEHPIPFEQLWSRSSVVHLPTTAVRIAAIEDLIELKRLAGRPEDLQDIRALEEILERQSRKL